MSESPVRPDGSRVQSVQRGHAILEALSRGPIWSTAADLATATGLNRTVAYRLLRTLEDQGLVRSSGGRFALGEENLRLGNAYLESLGFYRSTLTYAIVLCHRFVQDTPWVVSLGVPVADEVVLVDRMYGKDAPLDIILEVGTRLPIAPSALGRAILSGRTQDEVAVLLGDDHAEGLGERLAAIREHGVAFSDGEVRRDIAAMAAPIVSRERRVVAAIGVSGTDLGPHLTVDSTIAQRLRETAQDLSRAMQDRPA